MNIILTAIAAVVIYTVGFVSGIIAIFLAKAASQEPPAPQEEMESEA